MKQMSLLAVPKAIKMMRDEFFNALGNLENDEKEYLIETVVKQCAEEKQNKYTLIGRYSAAEQLFDMAKKRFYQLDEDGILFDLLEQHQVETQKTKDESDLSENDKEYLLNVICGSTFKGTQKQIEWAKDIAIYHLSSIPKDMTIQQIPTDANWWIENRNNIYSSIRKIV